MKISPTDGAGLYLDPYVKRTGFRIRQVPQYQRGARLLEFASPSRDVLFFSIDLPACLILEANNRLVGHENRQGRGRQDFSRNAAKDELAHARAAVSSHDDQVSANRDCLIENGFGLGAARRIHIE